VVPAQLQVRGALEFVVQAGEHRIGGAHVAFARAFQQLGDRYLIHASLARPVVCHGIPPQPPVAGQAGACTVAFREQRESAATRDSVDAGTLP